MALKLLFKFAQTCLSNMYIKSTHMTVICCQEIKIMLPLPPKSLSCHKVYFWLTKREFTDFSCILDIIYFQICFSILFCLDIQLLEKITNKINLKNANIRMNMKNIVHILLQFGHDFTRAYWCLIQQINFCMVQFLVYTDRNCSIKFNFFYVHTGRCRFLATTI